MTQEEQPEDRVPKLRDHVRIHSPTYFGLSQTDRYGYIRGISVVPSSRGVHTYRVVTDDGGATIVIGIDDFTVEG